MFIVLSYVKEPAQCLGQTATGILHNASRKQVSLHRLAGTICLWEVIFEAYKWALQFKHYIPVAVIPACIRQMGVPHRSGICLGNLLWEVTVPLAKTETGSRSFCRLQNQNLESKSKCKISFSLTTWLHYITCCLHNMLLLFIYNSQNEIENKIFYW